MRYFKPINKRYSTGIVKTDENLTEYITQHGVMYFAMAEENLQTLNQEFLEITEDEAFIELLQLYTVYKCFYFFQPSGKFPQNTCTY